MAVRLKYGYGLKSIVSTAKKIFCFMFMIIVFIEEE